MTFDSSSMPAAAMPATEAEEPATEAGREDAEFGSLVALLADASSVSSAEAAPAAASAPSRKTEAETDDAATTSLPDSPTDDAPAAAAAAALDGTPAGASLIEPAPGEDLSREDGDAPPILLPDLSSTAIAAPANPADADDDPESAPDPARVDAAAADAAPAANPSNGDDEPSSVLLAGLDGSAFVESGDGLDDAFFRDIGAHTDSSEQAPVAAPAPDEEAPAPSPALRDEHPEDDAADAVPGAADSGLVAAGPDEPAEAGPADVLDEAFLRGFVDAPGVSSDDAGVPAPAAASPVDDAQPVESAQAPPADDTDADAGDDAAAFADLSLEGSAALPAAPDTGAAAALEDIALEALPAGPAAALAFATDAETEVALRDGLFGYENVSSEGGDPQVWQGGLRAAIAALGDGHSAPLIFVDIDGIPYPAGAIHELASVCEVGTVVVAIGSDASARPGRELLLAGVSDYLAKPLTAHSVRAAAARAVGETVDGPAGGRAVAFIGSGGSGTTMLTALTALHAASRGCYVSVLDLDRSVGAAALALGVEPAAGFDQLLETAARTTPDAEMVEGVCSRRSDRIEVYAHRWGHTQPAAPQAQAVDCLIDVLRQRSQLVLVDGFEGLALCSAPPEGLDTRVFVAEPTVGKAAHLARMKDMLGADRPLLFVQNHTRAFRRGTRALRRGSGARALRDAGFTIEPDIVVPFEPSLPEAADRGWPRGRLPRPLRKPVSTLTSLLLDPPPGAAVDASPRPAGGS